MAEARGAPRYTRKFTLGDYGPDVEGVARALCHAHAGPPLVVFNTLPLRVRRTWGRHKQGWLVKFKRRHELPGSPLYGERTHRALAPHFDSRARWLMRKWEPLPERCHPIPAAVRYSIVGYPYAGTHNAGDWQSGNALDFKAPSGTFVLAPRSGRIYNVGGTDSIRRVGVKIIFGQKLTILTDEGPDIFLTHLARLRVRDGQRIHAGEIVGRIGYFGPGSHAHISFERGDPREMLGWKRIEAPGRFTGVAA